LGFASIKVGKNRPVELKSTYTSRIEGLNFRSFHSIADKTGLTMKHLIPLFFFIMSLCAASAQQQIGFINLSKAFDEYSRTKQLESELNIKASALKTNKDQLVKDMEALKVAYKKAREDSTNPIFSEKVQDENLAQSEALLAQLRDQEAKIRGMDEDARRQLMEGRRRAEKRIVDDIREVIQVYARQNQLTAVVDSSGPSATGVPFVLFNTPEVDITADIITILNRTQGIPQSGNVPTIPSVPIP